MKKLLWIVLALCLLAVPAMAEEACDHPEGECIGVGVFECWECGESVETITGEVYHNVNGNWEHNDTHHWGSCACGAKSVNEVHVSYCNDDQCWACGEEGVTIGDPQCHPGNISYEYDGTSHWGVCSGCGKEHDKEQHTVPCIETECIACGMTATAATPLYHMDVYEDYDSDDTHHWYSCGACGEKIKKAEHDFQNWEVVDEATCTETGKERSICFVCGVGSKDRDIEALGHTVTEWETVNEPAACMGWDGQKVGTCDTCGEEIWENVPFEGEALGEHVFESWTEVTPATCTEAGEEMSLCSYCGREDSVREIEALGHEGGEMEVTKEATCTEPGEKVGKCTRCGAEGETAVIEALGHTEVWTNTTEPTCLEAGEAAGTCSVCEADLGTKIVEALGHDEGAWVVAKEATREEEGLKELQCTRCGEVLDTEVIPMVTIVWYSNNTACVAGTEFRTLANVDTNKWYTFVELDLSQDGVQTFDLIASNIYRIGTVTVTVAEGNVTVDYDLVTDEIIVHDEFVTLFASLEDVTTVDQAAFTEYAYGEAINIQEALNGTTGYLYLCNVVTYHDEMLRIERVW